MATNDVVMTTEANRQQRNADDFKVSWRKNSDAAIGAYVIRTREVERLVTVMQDISVDKEVKFMLWKCNEGLASFPEPDVGTNTTIDISKPLSWHAASIDLGKCFEHISKAVTNDAIFVMQHPHFHFDKPLIQQHIHDFVENAREFDRRLVMICPETVKIPVEIEDKVHVMDFRVPSHAELLSCYDAIIGSIEDSVKPEFDEAEIDTIVQNAVGMTWMEFETALALAIVDMPKLLEARGEDAVQTPEDYIKVILAHKTEAIKKTDTLELMPAVSMDEVGGLDLLKDWLTRRATAYTQEARNYGISVPKGMLTVGPPGGGKSLLAKAVSSTLHTPLVKFDIGKIFGRYVGESESRMRMALHMIESMSPCVLLVDEIDKGFAGMGGGGGGGDGGISQRVFGQFLTWMQERDNDKHPVFVVMTANNVTGLPPELMRRGRLDEIFAVSFPSVEERMDILEIHLRKRGHTLSEKDRRKVAEETDEFVGAELESLVKDGLLEAFNEGLDKPTAAVFIRQAKELIPLAKAFPDRVQAMHEWAKNNAKPASTGMQFDGKAAPLATLTGPKGNAPRKLAIPAKLKKPESF